MVIPPHRGPACLLLWPAFMAATHEIGARTRLRCRAHGESAPCVIRRDRGANGAQLVPFWLSRLAIRRGSDVGTQGHPL